MAEKPTNPRHTHRESPEKKPPKKKNQGKRGSAEREAKGQRGECKN